MTVITHPRRKSKLATMIDSAGGVSVGVAVAQARDNIESLRAEAMTAIEAEISRLEAVPAPTGSDELSDRLDQAYGASTALIDAASPFDLTDLCRAAAGLCDLIGAREASAGFDWRIVTVHAQSLRLLLTLPPEGSQARTRVLDSLGDVIKRKLAQTS